MTDTATGAAADNAVKSDFMNDLLGKEPPQESDDAAVEPERQAAANSAKEEAEGDKEPEKKVLVPHGAFHEERERRKELQKQLADEKAARERLEERQNKLFEMIARKDKPEEEPFVDPLTKIENKVNEVVEKVNKKYDQETAETKEIRETNELVQKYAASAQAYSKDVPDFSEAYNYLLANRQKELSLMGFSPSEVNTQLRAEEKLIVTKAYAGEKNPAEIVYSLAKERGYKPMASDKSPKKTVEDIDKGLKASKSLGSGGAKAGDKDDLESLTAADLAEMSQEEFDSFFNKIEKQSKAKH